MANVQPLKAMNLDPNQIQGFIRFYKGMPEKSASTIRIFDHNEYYSVHEDDALQSADIVFHNNIVKYMGLEPKMKYLCLSQNNFENLIRELLLVRQYRVEVYAKVNANRVNEWKLGFTASPGNLQQFEDLLFDNNRDLVINSCVMGISLKGYNLGVSCINTTECDITVTEFIDNEFFSELEAVVAYINPKECVIPVGNTKELQALKVMLERNNVLVVSAKKDDYDESKLDQDLNRLLYFADKQQRNVQALFERNLTQAMSSTRAVITYLNLMSAKQNFNQYRLRSMDQKRFVRLDNAAIFALNILPKPGLVYSQYDTLYGVLNSCATPQGRRLLQRWMKQPLQDINILTDRLNAVEALVKDSDARSQLGYRLKLPDLLILAKKLGTKKATLQDCYKVYQALEMIPALVETLQNLNNASINALIVNPLSEHLKDFEKYQRMLEETMDLSLVDRDEYFVKPSYDEELFELYKQKQNLEEKMQKVFKTSARDLGLDTGKTIKLECTDQIGYFFRVTLKEEQNLRKNKTYTIVDAIKGGVRFTNDKLSSLNEDYSDIKQKYLQQQENTVAEILEVASGYSDLIKNTNLSIATADVLVSFALSAVNAPLPYVRPTLLPMGSGILRLKNARHPCLERQDENCIPNDVDFVSQDCTFKIITGPNMGGKSTYIRTIGVCTFLAHIGCFVPCKEAEISIVDAILTRVGAGDCVQKGLSTFMMEMIDTSCIMRCATSNSLVIIDELGRGTSTYDGCGIAWAVAEHLAKEIKAFTLFATHYHEITELENIIPTVSNYHVSMILSNNAITPLYSIKGGICDKSYGTQCAKIADFPENVIKWSEEYLQELEFAAGLRKLEGLEPLIKKDLINEGDDILQRVMGNLREKCKNNISHEEIKVELEKIKAELSQNGNQFIQGLLTTE